MYIEYPKCFSRGTVVAKKGREKSWKRGKKELTHSRGYQRLEKVGLRFGISSRLLASLPVREAILTAGREGFQGIEIWAFHLERDGKKGLQGLIRETMIEAAVHAPHVGLNLADRDDDLRKKAIRTVETSLEDASGLGLSKVAIHPGRWHREDPPSTEGYHLETLGYLAKRAESLGVTICLENMENRDGEVYVGPESVRGLVDAVGSPNLKVLLDLTHASTWGDPGEFMERLGKFHHVHMSDLGIEKTHVPLGTGRFDLDRLISELSQRYTGLVIIEVYLPWVETPEEEMEIVIQNRKFLEDRGWLR